MKILMLNYEYPPVGGGAGRAHLHLLREFSHVPGLSIDVLTASDTKNFRLEQFSSNIRIHRIGLHKKNLHYWRKSEVLEWLFKAAGYYKKLTTENHYDLVHSFFAFPSGYLCLKTAGKIPYLLSLRGSDVPGYNVRLKLDYLLLEGLFRKIWRNADAVIANSQGLAKLAAKFEPNLNIGVICNGIDATFFCPPEKRCLSSPVRLLTVCRLISRKRIDFLIEALREIRRSKLDAELNIVGEGNLLPELSALADKLNLSDKVHFHGRVDHEHLPSFYRENHFFLMSSEHEGMSNAMLEAMACGLPIVSTPCEGVEELIDAATGTVVDEDSPKGIAQAVCQLVQKPEIYEKMTFAAREKTMKFNWTETANQYIGEYRKILSK